MEISYINQNLILLAAIPLFKISSEDSFVKINIVKAIKVILFK